MFKVLMPFLFAVSVLAAFTQLNHKSSSNNMVVLCNSNTIPSRAMGS